jgi:hypothetical protein
MEFYRSTQFDCDTTHYSQCTNGQFDILNSSNFTDTVATLNRDSYYTLKSPDGHKSSTPITSRKFSPRYGHQIAALNGKLWLVGGSTGNPDQQYPTNDIWSSVDGINWSLEASNTILGDGYLIAFNNKLWLLDTFGKAGPWSSADGKNWEQSTEPTPFTRYSHNKFAVFNNKLWMIGAYNESYEPLNESWSSSDGIHWHLESQDAGFLTQNYGLIVFKKQLWLVGYKLSWSSSDGIHWSRHDSDFLHSGYQFLEMNGQLWFFIVPNRVGESSEFTKEVWTSKDAINWKQLTKDAPIPGLGTTTVSFKNKLWMIGGAYDVGDVAPIDTIRSSVDGISWSEETNGTNQLAGGGIFAFGDKLWAFAADYDQKKIATSANGIVWDQFAQIEAFAHVNTFNSEKIAFDDKLWIIGGSDTDNGIWNSTNGIDWIKQVSPTDFLNRTGHRLVTHKNQLWLIGGITTGYKNDVWSSFDGINWALKTDNAGFQPREGHRAVSFNDKLWVMGGKSVILVDRVINNTTYQFYETAIYKDLWCSGDGVIWNKIDSDVISENSAGRLIVFKNKLWLFGIKNIYSSTDGLTWNQEPDAPTFVRFVYYQDNQVVSFEDKLLLFGIGSKIWSSDDGQIWREGFHGTFFFK